MVEGRLQEGWEIDLHLGLFLVNWGDEHEINIVKQDLTTFQFSLLFVGYSCGCVTNMMV